MIRFQNILAATLIIAGVFSGVVYSGSLALFLVILNIGIYLLLPAFFLLFLWGTTTLLKRRSLGKIFQSIIMVWCAGSLCLILAGVVSSSSYYYWKIKPLRDYVAIAVPVLAKIKVRTGSYPAQLPVSELGEPPQLLRYSGGKDDFSFLYFEPGEFGDLYIFKGPNGGWNEYS